jgi:hypothetical protein
MDVIQTKSWTEFSSAVAAARSEGKEVVIDGSACSDCAGCYRAEVSTAPAGEEAQ